MVVTRASVLEGFKAEKVKVIFSVKALTWIIQYKNVFILAFNWSKFSLF